MVNKRDSLSIVLLFACTAVFLSPVLFTGKSFFLRDLTNLFHPWRTLAAGTLQGGQMPLWNPYAYCGMPFLANWQSAILYPFSILFYLFPFAAALKLFGLAHFFLAGLFAFLFGRKAGLNRPGALGMALVFSFNGYLVTRSEFLSHFGVDIWTFALLLFIDSPLLLALGLSISFLAGHQVFLLQAAIVIAYGLLVGTGRPPRVSLANMATAFLYATALTAVQLLPTAELAGFSARVKEGVGAAAAMVNALTFPDLARLISPLFPSSIAPIAGERLPWPTTFHAGFIACIAAVLALFGTRSRRTVFAAGLAFAGLVLALGNSTPVYPWLYSHFPVMQLVRYPSQYLFLTATGIAILAGTGLARFGYAAAALCAVELLASGYAFQATAPDSYFTVRPRTVAVLRSAAGHDRFILSPGTEMHRFIRGTGIPDAWQTARSFLYGMTCLPYRLRNAYGSGEPLVPAPVEDMVKTAYRQTDPRSALPWFALLGVRSLLTRTPLPDETGYQRVADDPLAVYRIKASPGLLSLSAGNGENAAAVDDSVPGRVRYAVRSGMVQTVTWRETACPGWELYLNGQRSAYDPGDGAFRSWQVGPGTSRIVEVYRPLSFRIGLAITLAAAVFLLICAIIL